MNTEVTSGIVDTRPIRVGRAGEALLVALSMLCACGGSYESSSRREPYEVTRAARPEDRVEAEPVIDGKLDAYLAFAISRSPEIRMAFERWKAATLAVSRARRLPEPVIKYSYYVRSVETRVGPQQHRLSLEQWFPWPTKLTAAADAASAEARAEQERVNAEVLAVKEAVSRAYWRLWLIQEEHRLKTEHDVVLETLAGTVRGRVSTGAASLADLNQVELGVAVHHDHHGEHLEQERAASAELLRAIGSTEQVAELPVTGSPGEGLPAQDIADLREAARRNPAVEALGLMATASDEHARAEAAERAPDLATGLNWIVTGEAPTPVPGSGQDAVIVSAGLTLPLWGRNYKQSVGSARAEAAAHRAQRDAALQQADAAVAASLAAVRDSQRRIDLYRSTLIPQAETTFRSVLGGYRAGRSDVASALLAQRDLLELQLDLARSRARHAIAWAELEHVVGHEIAAARRGGQP